MSSLPLRIREFSSEDFEELYLMDQVCFPEGIAFSRGELFFYLSHRRTIVRIADQAGRIAGFVLARTERLSSAHLITLDVAPDRRRCGIGTMLMNEVHRELEKRKIRLSILEVGVSNFEAQRLYRKFGYQKTEMLIGYYRGSEDAYRMELLIDT